MHAPCGTLVGENPKSASLHQRGHGFYREGRVGPHSSSLKSEGRGEQCPSSYWEGTDCLLTQIAGWKLTPVSARHWRPSGNWLAMPCAGGGRGRRMLYWLCAVPSTGLSTCSGAETQHRAHPIILRALEPQGDQHSGAWCWTVWSRKAGYVG